MTIFSKMAGYKINAHKSVAILIAMTNTLRDQVKIMFPTATKGKIPTHKTN